MTFGEYLDIETHCLHFMLHALLGVSLKMMVNGGFASKKHVRCRLVLGCNICLALFYSLDLLLSQNYYGTTFDISSVMT